ncbi:hypothetical protein J3R30DRAFT_3299284 [Lentinula aciculospora]|uniref:BTB domain-containing protein n=1 Tax=Lentinula aciculospora TaxID=153920 RepID=A0A9W9DHZ7_9AGAR|nr:hypothetical protein J3R30DRAFT_3299284 [Lentinula aciculospora]
MWLYSYSYAPREIPRFASVFSSVYIGGSRVVKLQGIETHQFDLVLSLFYPKDLLHQEPKSFNDWSDILHVAHTIDMYQIGALAISKINDLGSTVSPVDKIDLANKYGIKEWLEPSYMALVGRLDDLTLEEDKKIGRGAQLIHSCRDAVRGQLQMLIEENNVYLPAP